MSDDEERGRPELRPARPDARTSDAGGAEGRPSYMPRVPWRWILLGTAGIVALFAVYYVRKQQTSDALRQQMLTLHEERLTELSGRYLAFRERLEGLIAEAAQGGEPEQWVDPRLNISGLRGGAGLYVRLPVAAARERAHIGPASQGAQPDAIMRCLGIAPMNLSGLYEKGEFLTPEWVESLRSEQDQMRLRVLDDQLGRHVQVDVPVITTMMQADWFMLVVQQGENRRDEPVDVFLWDLRRNEPLLRARIQARGLLVPVRLSFEGAGPAAPAADRDARSGAAQDCSIASQIRALTGPAPLEFESGDALVEEESEPPEPQPAASD